MLFMTYFYSSIAFWLNFSFTAIIKMSDIIRMPLCLQSYFIISESNLDSLRTCWDLLIQSPVGECHSEGYMEPAGA